MWLPRQHPSSYRTHLGYLMSETNAMVFLFAVSLDASRWRDRIRFTRLSFPKPDYAYRDRERATSENQQIAFINILLL